MFKKAKYLIGIFILLIFVNQFSQHQFDEDFKVVFCDVGQGDGVLIVWPNDLTILIDGGPDKKILACLDKNLPTTKKKIDIVVLSHSDADHVGGLPEVLQRYDVGQVWYGDDDGDNPAYQSFLKIITQKNIDLKKVVSNQKFVIDDNSNIEIFWPLDYDRLDSEVDANNMSVVLKIFYQNTSWLFVGDIEEKTEKILLNNNYDLKSDVYKVGHHGSNTSSSIDFVEQIKPNVSVVSVGADNNFGHPSGRVLKRLENINSEIYRTDQTGEVILTSNGQDIYFQKCLDFWPYLCYSQGNNLNNI